MAKKAAKAASKKAEGGRVLIAGCIEPESTVANLYKALKDGKFHSIESLESCLTDKKINLNRRIRNLGMKGLESKQWTIEVEDGERVRMVTGKPAAGATLPHFRTTTKAERPPAKKGKPASKKKAAAAPAAKKANGPARASVQDVPVEDED